MYLENYQLATAQWFDKQIENSNFDVYNSLAKKAILLPCIILRLTIYLANNQAIKRPNIINSRVTQIPVSFV